MKPLGCRIAFDARPALWPRTGIGTVARNILRHIRAADLSCEFHAYFDCDPGALAAEIAPLRCAHGGPRHKLLWSNTWLRRQLRRDGIDIFITFLDKEVPLLPSRARVAPMVHDLIPMRLPGVVFRNFAHRVYYNALIRLAVWRADLVFTNSRFSASEIVRMLHVPPEKVQRLTFGAEYAPEPGPHEIDAALSRYSLAPPFVLAMGANEPRKNNWRVIEAVRLLAERHPNLRLAIAGSAWRGHPFDSPFLNRSITLLGHVPDADLRALMASAAALVFPSLHEGFGLPVLEAMTVGLPVITSPRTALPEVGGDAVLYADPESAHDLALQIDRILTQPGLAGELREKGRERARLFRWDTTCAEMMHACAGLMENRPWQGQPVLR